jgi:predicted DNA-binding transcriptional regulator AlpA
MVKRGTLPAPRKLSAKVTAWNVGELRRCLNAAEVSA